MRRLWFLETTDNNIGRKYPPKLIEQEKKILDSNMIYHLKILVANMLKKVLLRHGFRIFYPRNALSNDSLSVLRERIKDMPFFSLRSMQLVF